MEKDFTNIKSYTAAMSQSVVLQDKLFFLQELPEDSNIGLVVDFGCADGSLIYTLQSCWPTARFIGYDKSKAMIGFAKSKLQDSKKIVQFTSNWDDVENWIPKAGTARKKLLILSSVIHEVYSYAEDEAEVKTFWKRVFETGFDYIAIRDMMISQDVCDTRAPRSYVETIISSNFYYPYVQDFNKHQEPFHTSMKDFIHFLVKSKWTVNWDREVNENYFPITLEELLQRVKESGEYRVDYLKRFCPLKQDIKERFQIELQENTHIKLILSKKSI